MLINLTNYPECHSTEEAAFFGALELDAIEPPLSEDEAFDWINGRVYELTWPDDEFPW